ncbi:hypothetical protein W97_01589 [Coniosporium apollinis CBS 100218]|uniref:Transmembrane protein n=1 Tax=Coniosporium apollinis (strain CBS 100218) TaxID=1168221 RepID=R7YKB4_CONA1|nr:uncharacterized protein W97_01589 [Coniosporium apollinis CBS 100218]EON62367.1 hypothetical protein W97_01589 [Coniosporium apollinis CBS 100218]
MSSDSLAIFRRTGHEDLQKLAEEHFKHDLEDKDRETLYKAAGKLSRHAAIGSIVGLGLGLYAAYRLRNARLAYFQAFRAAEKPKAVQFADGRTEPIPDLEPLLRPSRWGDIATYTLFGISGLFLGGETGLLTGSASARRTVRKDPESKARIEKAFRKFRAEVLRKQADALEGTSSLKEKIFG